MSFETAKNLMPAGLRSWLGMGKRRMLSWPPIRRIRFSTLQTVTPLSRVFGLDRGRSICRYYVEDFLMRNAADIRGCVLEVADNNYTTRFGKDKVTRSEVLHVHHGNPRATIVADLTAADHVPSSAFDCIVFTQTLQFIYDTRAAVRTLNRILKPGGVLLSTFPGISQTSRYDMDRWGEYWRFTTLSARKLFEEAFPSANVQVEAYGNVLAANAYLYGLAAEELNRKELDHRDVDYEVLITVKAVKAGAEV